VVTKAFDIRPELAERALRDRVAEVHERGPSYVELGSIQLADGRAEHPAALGGRALVWHPEDGVFHESKLGTRLLELRLRRAARRMDFV